MLGHTGSRVEFKSVRFGENRRYSVDFHPVDQVEPRQNTARRDVFYTNEEDFCSCFYFYFDFLLYLLLRLF